MPYFSPIVFVRRFSTLEHVLRFITILRGPRRGRSLTSLSQIPELRVSKPISFKPVCVFFLQLLHEGAFWRSFAPFCVLFHTSGGSVILNLDSILTLYR